MILTKNRQLHECPPHFIKIPMYGTVTEKNTLGSAFRTFAVANTFDDIDDTGYIRNWLHENCEHRFFIGNDAMITNKLIVEDVIIGFEHASDATYFSLILTSLLKRSI